MEKLYVIVPVWGKTYVERFCRRGLASLLTSGNLPGLEDLDCEWKILFATSQKDAELIGEITREYDIAGHVEVLSIDDLMWGSYGMILTAAYAKAIKSSWSDERNTVFMFSNADFLFSNGLVTNAYRHLSEGYGAVYCPSLRCVDSSELDDACQNWRDRGGDGYSASEMAKFALDDPHPTLFCNFLNGIDELQRIGSHQLFWDVTEDCLVGAWFLQFMLMVKPERKLDKVHSFVDYSLVPQLLEKGKFYSPDFSEEMLILEPTEVEYEVQDILVLKQGSTMKEDLMVEDLTFWTTAVHRELGKKPYTVVGKADLTPPSESIREFEKRLAEINTRVSETAPKETAGHIYWRSGMDGQVPWIPDDCALLDHLDYPEYRISQKLVLDWGARLGRRLFHELDSRIQEIAEEGALLVTNLRWLAHLYKSGRGKIAGCELLGQRKGPIPSLGHLVLAGSLDDSIVAATNTLSEDEDCRSISIAFVFGDTGYRLRNRARANLLRYIQRSGNEKTGLSDFPSDGIRFWENIYIRGVLARTFREKIRFFWIIIFQTRLLLSTRLNRILARLAYGKRRNRGNLSALFWAKAVGPEELEPVFSADAFATRKALLRRSRK